MGRSWISQKDDTCRILLVVVTSPSCLLICVIETDNWTISRSNNNNTKDIVSQNKSYNNNSNEHFVMSSGVLFYKSLNQYQLNNVPNFNLIKDSIIGEGMSLLSQLHNRTTPCLRQHLKSTRKMWRSLVQNCIG